MFNLRVEALFNNIFDNLKNSFIFQHSLFNYFIGNILTFFDKNIYCYYFQMLADASGDRMKIILADVMDLHLENIFPK